MRTAALADRGGKLMSESPPSGCVLSFHLCLIPHICPQSSRNLHSCTDASQLQTALPALPVLLQKAVWVCFLSRDCLGWGDRGQGWHPHGGVQDSLDYRMEFAAAAEPVRGVSCWPGPRPSQLPRGATWATSGCCQLAGLWPWVNSSALHRAQ